MKVAVVVVAVAQAQLNQAQVDTGTATSRMQSLWWLREDLHEVEHLPKAIYPGSTSAQRGA